MLPGKDVAVGETWTWKGDLLNLYQNGDLTATFTFREVVKVDGEECARITGEVSGWNMERWKTPDQVPKCRVEVLFSLSRGLPVKGTHVYESPSRTTRIETKLAPAK